MEILECITEQIAATRLPLVGVTLAAVACPDTPIILTLHWHGFIKEQRAERESADIAALMPVPSTSLQLNGRWSDLMDLELATLEAGWELGAWDLVRSQRPGCMRPGAPGREALECLQAFGNSPTRYHGNDLVVSATPDADELIKVAGHSGYLCWQFRPIYGGLWAEVREDATLNADGKRTPQCPLSPLSPRGEGAHRTVYKFGKAPAAA
ncbi:MAG: diguanylate cyclase [Burkholderiales bacterium]|nr:diguanylate cyclase [Burkholderiales bacterium]